MKKKNSPQDNFEHEYPRISELGLTIVTKCPNSIPGVSFAEIKEKLGNKKYKIFADMYGCQTCGMNGPYVYDIEAVLERMMSGKLKGTQLFFD